MIRVKKGVLILKSDIELLKKFVTEDKKNAQRYYAAFSRDIVRTMNKDVDNEIKVITPFKKRLIIP